LKDGYEFEDERQRFQVGNFELVQVSIPQPGVLSLARGAKSSKPTILAAISSQNPFVRVFKLLFRREIFLLSSGVSTESGLVDPCIECPQKYQIITEVLYSMDMLVCLPVSYLRNYSTIFLGA
jgi:hypothetical protein